MERRRVEHNAGGMAQALDGIGNVRVLLAVIEGGPNAPVIPANDRVSAMRHGTTGKYANAELFVAETK